MTFTTADFFPEAAHGGLKPPPTGRLRRVLLHLSHSMTLARLLDTKTPQVCMLPTALRDLGDAPTRSLTALARRLGVPEAVAVVAASPEEPQPVSPPPAAPVAGPLSPLLPMTGRNGASSAPRTLLNRRNVTVARKRIIR